MSRKSSALTGLLPVAYIALGLILILWPSMSSGIFCRLVGIGALAYGLLHLLNFWRFARGRGELAAGILLANNFVLFFYAGTLAVPVWLAKILTEITPFLICLPVQAGLIFRKDTQGKHFVR